MNKLLIISALCLGLVGCQTAQDVATSITTVTQTTAQKVKSVQGYATQICSYVPLASSVVNIFSSGYSSDVSTVANAICDAVTSIPLADGPGDHKPRVNGVVIKGSFVK